DHFMVIEHGQIDRFAESVGEFVHLALRRAAQTVIKCVDPRQFAKLLPHAIAILHDIMCKKASCRKGLQITEHRCLGHVQRLDHVGEGYIMCLASHICEDLHRLSHWQNRVLVIHFGQLLPPDVNPSTPSGGGHGSNRKSCCTACQLPRTLHMI